MVIGPVDRMKSRAYLKKRNYMNRLKSQAMSPIKTIILSFLIISISFYLVGSFSNAGFNIAHWNAESRSIYGGVCLAVWLMSSFFVLINDTAKR